MHQWTEFRTAYTLARLGTVSAAARELGIHRGTVIRHVDALEANIGVRLFQRHARGYTPTEAGLDLQRVARTTDERLGTFVERARGRETDVTGEVIVTSVDSVAMLVCDGIARFRAQNPGTRVKYVATGRPLDLAYGLAHIAIRAGSRPDHPDHVVRPFFQLRSTFYAHQTYIEERGLPTCVSELEAHVYVSHQDPQRTPFFRWLEQAVPPDTIVLRSSSQRVLMESLLAGIGIGFMPVVRAARVNALQGVMPAHADWVMPLWLVTHIDLHRTSKVQALSAALIEAVQRASVDEPYGRAPEWGVT